MDLSRENIRAMIHEAGASGITVAGLKKEFGLGGGPSKDIAALKATLTGLVRDGEVRGPFKGGNSPFYFGGAHGPSIETVGGTISELVFKSGIRLASRTGLLNKLKGAERHFFPDGLKHAVSSQSILEMAFGTFKVYLHRDVAADYFGFVPAPPDAPGASATPPLTLDALLPVYRRLRAGQRGSSTVKIFDLMQALDGSKEALHELLIAEAKTGRVTIHPATAVDLPKEVIDAGIRLPGFPETFVTVVVASEP